MKINIETMEVEFEEHELANPEGLAIACGNMVNGTVIEFINEAVVMAYINDAESAARFTKQLEMLVTEKSKIGPAMNGFMSFDSMKSFP